MSIFNPAYDYYAMNKTSYCASVMYGRSPMESCTPFVPQSPPQTLPSYFTDQGRTPRCDNPINIPGCYVQTETAFVSDSPQYCHFVNMGMLSYADTSDSS